MGFLMRRLPLVVGLELFWGKKKGKNKFLCLIAAIPTSERNDATNEAIGLFVLRDVKRPRSACHCPGRREEPPRAGFPTKTFIFFKYSCRWTFQLCGLFRIPNSPELHLHRTHTRAVSIFSSDSLQVSKSPKMSNYLICKMDFNAHRGYYYECV